MLFRRAISSLLTVGFLSAASASPTGQPGNISALPTTTGLDSVQTGPFAVTGVQNGSAIQPRLEIRDLQNNADQFNIFLLGLQNMQQTNQSDYLSYFQVAG
jgi:tyrosinase